MATVLNRDDILGAIDIQKEIVEVPEWGGSVCVRGMTGFERDAFEASIVKTQMGKKGMDQALDMTNVRAKLAAVCICDEAGVRLFTDKDMSLLAKKSASALQRVFKVAQRLSGIGDEDIKELTEGLKENPSEDSASA